MEIKESSNASLIALFVVIILFILIIGFILLDVQSNKYETKFQDIYDKAYIDGYLKGKEDGAIQILEIQKEYKENNNKNNW